MRESFDIATGDFAGNGVQEVAVAWVAPYTTGVSSLAVSIYGMRSGQLANVGGYQLQNGPFSVSIATGHVLAGPNMSPGDDIVVGASYPTAQYAFVWNLARGSDGTFDENSLQAYQTTLTDVNKTHLKTRISRWPRETCRATEPTR